MKTSPVVVVLLAVLVAVPSAVLADVPAARLTVSSAVVSPTDPVVGEPVTVDVTVSNSLASGSAVAIRQVELRTGRDTGARTLAETFDVGALSPGDSLSVPLVVTFERAGDRTPIVRIVAIDADDERVELFRPVPIVVADAPLLIEIETGPAAVDSPVTVDVRLANPSTAAARNVVVTFVDAPGETPVDRRTVAALPASGVETVSLEFVPDAPGDRTVSIRASYLTAAGTPAAVTGTRPVAVEPFVDDVGVAIRPLPPASSDDGLSVDPADLGGVLGGVLADPGGGDEGASAGATASRVEVVVTNFGTVRVDDVVVTPVAVADDRPLPRVALDGPLAPGETTAVVVDLAPIRTDGPVRFDLSYDAGVRVDAGAATGTYDWRPPRGEVRLTDVDVVVDEDGPVTVRGNVANVGRAAVTGVVVAVREADGVRPAYPTRDYFVGTVGDSDFAPFEVTASVEGDDPVTVPLRVTYQENGERFVVDVPVEYVPERSSGGGLGVVGGVVERAGAGSLPIPPAILVVGAVLTALPVLAYVVRRRSPDGRAAVRDGDESRPTDAREGAERRARTATPGEDGPP